eukprot:COSAG02_NODE_36073_length_459_cov_1.147222_1_plen_63_part_10
MRGKKPRSGYAVVGADDVEERHEPDERQGDRLNADEEDPLTGNTAASIYVEASRRTTRRWCSV